MENTNILCPECFKGRIWTEDGKVGSCNKCSTKFTITGKNSVKYYEPEEQIKDTPSINSFVSRKLNFIPRTKWEEFMSYPKVDYEDKQYADPKYNWIMCICDDARDTKYGRQMISVEYKLRRGQTMGEFYGSGIVD